jgi:hypothetical protein
LPHSPQNFIDGGFSKPQLAHFDFSDAPQNFIPLAFSEPQAGQRIDGPVGSASTVDPPATEIQGNTRVGCFGDHRLGALASRRLRRIVAGAPRPLQEARAGEGIAEDDGGARALLDHEAVIIFVPANI